MVDFLLFIIIWQGKVFVYLMEFTFSSMHRNTKFEYDIKSVVDEFLINFSSRRKDDEG